MNPEFPGCAREPFMGEASVPASLYSRHPFAMGLAWLSPMYLAGVLLAQAAFMRNIYASWSFQPPDVLFFFKGEVMSLVGRDAGIAEYFSNFPVLLLHAVFLSAIAIYGAFVIFRVLNRSLKLQRKFLFCLFMQMALVGIALYFAPVLSMKYMATHPRPYVAP